MAHKNRTRPDQGRVGGNMLPGALPHPNTFESWPAQLIASRYGLAPALAGVIAALAFPGTRL